MNQSSIESEITRLENQIRSAMTEELKIVDRYRDEVASIRSKRIDYENRVRYLKNLISGNRASEFTGFLGE